MFSTGLARGRLRSAWRLTGGLGTIPLVLAVLGNAVEGRAPPPQFACRSEGARDDFPLPCGKEIGTVPTSDVRGSPPPNLPHKGGGMASSERLGSSPTIGEDAASISLDAVPPPLRGRLGGGKPRTSEVGIPPTPSDRAESAQSENALVRSPAADGCPLELGLAATVARVVDGDTLALDDGTEVRLIGALSARPSFATRPWRIEMAAKAALEDLVAGRGVQFGHAGRRTNRHGQTLAHVFVERNGETVWVQGDLIASGFARAYGVPGNFGCMAELRARERTAREGGAGLWADPAFAVAPAEPARDLLRRQGTFQIVRGEVRKVERIKERVFLNFGDDWRRDFTAGASVDPATGEPGWVERLPGLEGRTVEVRGWIERRYGPFIELWDESQIEIVGATGEGGRAPEAANEAD